MPIFSVRSTKLAIAHLLAEQAQFVRLELRQDVRGLIVLQQHHHHGGAVGVVIGDRFGVHCAASAAGAGWLSI
jgi:hypothetical protein